MSGLEPPIPSDEPICSRAGCRAPATHRVVWRNPRIHAADREKVWLACAAHRGFLSEYLSTRGFPVAVHPFDPVEGSR